MFGSDFASSENAAFGLGFSCISARLLERAIGLIKFENMTMPDWDIRTRECVLTSLDLV